MKITYPSRAVGNPKFRYVPSHKTDLSKTFARARRLIRMQLHREAVQGKEQNV
jgi:hypothetical protein